MTALAALPSARPARARSCRTVAAHRLRGLGPAAVGDGELLSLATGVELAIARQLMDAAGGLAGLSMLDAAELGAVSRLSPTRAAALVATFEVGRRVAAAAAEPGWVIRSPADVADRLCPAMRHLEREELRVLQLGTKNAVIATSTLYVGNLAGSSVRVGEVFRDAVRRQAAAVVVVHNHPSGDPTPSADDLRITSELAEAGRLLDIELLDHVVVAARGWVSLRALGAADGQSSTRMR